MKKINKLQSSFFKSLKSFWWFLLLFVHLSLFSVTFLVGIIFSNQTLIIGGSTSVYPLFQALKKNLGEEDNAYQYIAGGSYAGLWSVIDQRFLVGFMSKEFVIGEDKEVSDTLMRENLVLKKFTLAKDGIIMIYQLPADCESENIPTNLNLTTAKLKKIYGSPDSLKWKELDGEACDNSEQKIYRISRENGSGTRSVFEEKIMDNEKIYTDNVEKSSGPILKSIQITPGQMAYVSYSYIDKITEMNKKNPRIGYAYLDGVAPTETTFSDESYVLFRPFIGLYLEKNEERLAIFFRFLSSEKTKKTVQEAKFIYVYET